jgi:hypothetical protein
VPGSRGAGVGLDRHAALDQLALEAGRASRRHPFARWCTPLRAIACARG